MPNFLLGQRNLAIGHAADAFAKRKEERQRECAVFEPLVETLKHILDDNKKDYKK